MLVSRGGGELICMPYPLVAPSIGELLLLLLLTHCGDLGVTAAAVAVVAPVAPPASNSSLAAAETVVVVGGGVALPLGESSEGESGVKGRSHLASDKSGLGLFLLGNVWSREPPLANSSRSLELRHFMRRF